MDILKTRSELRKMSKVALFKLGLNQKMSYCLVGGRSCGLLLQYQGSNFCISEILGEGCQVKRLNQLEQFYDQKKEFNFLLPFMHKIQTELLLSEKKDLDSKPIIETTLLVRSSFLERLLSPQSESSFL
jgi:hypothetical protein